MSVSTYPALWPTEEALGFLDDKLQEAFNDLELVTHRMKEATAGARVPQFVGI